MVHPNALPLEISLSIFDINSAVLQPKQRASTIAQSLIVFADDGFHLALFVVLVKAPLAELGLVHFYPSGSVSVCMKNSREYHTMP